MATLKIGTFNVENLFLRYELLDHEKGKRTQDPLTFADFKKRGNINMLGFRLDEMGPISHSARTLTAQVITENDADVLALQEVENLEALKQFNRIYLKNLYPYMMVVDGNDPRQIDVGILSKRDIVGVRTHQFEPKGSPITKRIFSRDCLEVDISVPGSNEPVTILVNHFKSKIGGGEEKRERQATRVAEILRERFGSQLKGRFVVAGDLNAGPDEDALKPLLSLPGVKNTNERISDPDERWTHYYNKTKEAEQLDYLILSRDLANATAAKPHIERRGLGKDIKHYAGPRFNKNLTGAQGASDHCAVFLNIPVS